MHPNPVFRKADPEQNIEFARKRGFGTLAINGENGPLISHVPFILSNDGSFVEAQLCAQIRSCGSCRKILPLYYL